MNINPTQLTKTNWDTWLTEIECYAASLDCSECLDKDYTVEPTGNDLKKKQTCRLVILKGLSEQDKLYVNECKNPKEMIAALQLAHNKKTSAFHLEKELFDFAWPSAEEPEYFVGRMNNLINRFKKSANGATVDESKFIMKICELMPDRLASLREHIYLKLALDETVAYEDVCKWLIAAWNNSKAAGRSGVKVHIKEEEQAFISYGQNRKWCQFHRSASHSDEECRANRNTRAHSERPEAWSNPEARTNYVRRDNQDRQQASSRSAESAMMAVEYDDCSFMAVKSGKTKYNQRKMHLDDAASAHIVNRIEVFSEYQPFEPEVSMDSINGGAAAGVGKVKIVSRVGDRDVTSTLSNVLHIPTSPCSMLSEMVLQDEGLDPKFERSGGYAYLNYQSAGRTIIESKRRLKCGKPFEADVRFAYDEDDLIAVSTDEFTSIERSADNRKQVASGHRPSTSKASTRTGPSGALKYVPDWAWTAVASGMAKMLAVFAGHPAATHLRPVPGIVSHLKDEHPEIESD